MPSPFPGMNPYLEQADVWHGFHERFIPRAAAMLTPQVVPDFIVNIDDNVFLHEQPADQRRLLGRPDVSVAQPGPVAGVAPGTTLEAPAYGELPLAVGEERLSYLEIRDRRSRTVVTVIELLSPANKYAGPDRDQYLAKRRQIIRSRVHLVEIDLLRGGPRMPVQGLTPCDYCVMVSRAEERPRVGLWPLGLRDPLPPVIVPLPAPHAGARLDLQALVHAVYDEAGYEYYVYDGQPEPPLSPEDAAWAAQFLPPRP